MMETVSVVVPCYNEQDALPLFYAEICKAADDMPGVSLELVLVDDGSCDGTLRLIKEFAQNDARVKYIAFSRNFGKESAMLAGLERASGGYVAVMDADLQDPPPLLPQMLSRLQSGGHDCVATRRVTRKGEPAIRSLFARSFYRIMGRISNTKMVDGARDFRLMSRRMTDAILDLKEVNRFSKGIFGWVGFDTEWIEYENAQRAAGETKWSFWKLLLYSIDGMLAFSTAPLAISSVAGFVFCVVALMLAAFYGIKAFFFGDPVSGFPTLICIILLACGIQLFSVGVLGQYLAKTYTEVKRRPKYIIKESSFCEKQSRLPKG